MAEVTTAVAPTILPVRARCNMHAAWPDPDCNRCHTAQEITGWWAHAQDRCDPFWCLYCARQAGYGR